jgi:diadenosine tetraphosphate (Ap4A) HIT family hydrolase
MFKLHDMLENDCIRLAETDLNLLLLMNDSGYPWFVLVPKREHIKEMFQLSDKEQLQFTKESAFLAEQLYRLFEADKMNIAALGNMCPQLHIHHIARYKSDKSWPAPIWGKFPTEAYSKEQINVLKEKIKPSLSSMFTF